MRPHTTTVVISAALLALGLTACSGDTGPSSSEPAPVTGQAPEETGTGDAGAASGRMTNGADATPAADLSTGGRGRGRHSHSAPPAAPARVTAATGDLTADEIEGLIFMREEEKLARDVYLTMFEAWGLPVFENIAASETRHTEAVLELIEAYGLDDPVADDAGGVFVNPTLGALYDDLVARGSTSLVDALTVGALIEDLDISDLRTWLDKTDNPDIERVYGSLLSGSEKHLVAFGRQLDGQGATYEATYLDQAEIDAILESDNGRGRNR